MEDNCFLLYYAKSQHCAIIFVEMVAKLWSTLLHVIVWEILKWANTFVTYLYVYPRQGCHAPSVGRHPCVSFFVLALLGVLHTPHSHLLAGCSTYLSSWLLIAYRLMPIAYCLLPIAYCLLPIAYCLLPIACRCRCYVSRQDQV